MSDKCILKNPLKSNYCHARRSGMWSCNYCDAVFSNKKELLEHFEMQSNKINIGEQA